MIVCDTNGNSLRGRLLRESELTFPNAISAGHVAEETLKNSREILKSNETTDLHEAKPPLKLKT